MEPGEKEMRLVFEEVTRRNVQAAIDFGNETRKLVRELEEKVKNLEKILLTKDETINEIKKQMSSLQQKIYMGGSD